MNHRNYPLLTRLFEQLNVELRDSDMSFGYHDVPSGLQYCGSGLDGLFAQRSNLFRPSFHRMVRDVRTGVMHVNTYGGADGTVPLGGVGQSGNGHDKSLHAVEKYINLKTAWIKL